MTFIQEQKDAEIDLHRSDKQKADSHATEKIRSMNIRISELTDALDLERTENGKKVAAYNILKKKFDNQEKEMSSMMDDLISKTNKIRELEKSSRNLGSAENGDQMKRQARLQNLRIQELELEIERINRTGKSKVQELEETCRLFQRDLNAQKDIVTQLTQEKNDLMKNMNGGGADDAVNSHLQKQLAARKRKYYQSQKPMLRFFVDIIHQSNFFVC